LRQHSRRQLHFWFWPTTWRIQECREIST
jgi:hypothetical protein